MTTLPKMVVFDLDGTLAESKQPLTGEMAQCLTRLLDATNVAVISGGALAQFLKQIVDQLPPTANLSNLFLLPTSGAALYEFQNGEFMKVYEERLSEEDSQKITDAMRIAGTETGIIDFSQPAHGERIEYRGSQVTLSALGQKAPIEEKKAWDPTRTKRESLRDAIALYLPEFLVRIGGSTSIDVTKLGIDKAYGLRKLCARLGVPESETLFIGDELQAGGNDEAVYKTEARTQSVTNPHDTMRIIESFFTNA